MLERRFDEWSDIEQFEIVEVLDGCKGVKEAVSNARKISRRQKGGLIHVGL